MLTKQLRVKDEIIEELEIEIAIARVKLQNKNKQQDSSNILEEIINIQIPHSDKSGLGFDSKSNDNGTGTKIIEDKDKSYRDTLRGPNGQMNHPHNYESKNAWKRPASRRTVADSEDRHKEHNVRKDNIQSKEQHQGILSCTKGSSLEIFMYVIILGTK